jgi:hypothetical protein
MRPKVARGVMHTLRVGAATEPPGPATPGEGPRRRPDARTALVPPTPGPLVLPGRPQRARDDLDDLVDELFPETDEGPAWFDAALIAAGTGLVAWWLAGSGPGWALAAGLLGAALGAILPVRSAWRWVRGRRLARVAGRGVVLRLDDPACARLAQAYGDLVDATGGDGAAWAADPARHASHGALLEVATLLGGHPAASDVERRYVAERALAIERLASAIRRRSVAEATPDPALVVAARRELDALTDGGTLARLAALAAEARRGRDPG